MPCRSHSARSAAQVGRVAEQVDGDDRAGARRDGRLDRRRIEVVVGADVGEHGHGADRGDRLGRGVEGVRRADHLVAALDADGAQRERERVGAVRDADAVRDAERGGGLLLEGLDLRAEDVATGVDDVDQCLLGAREELRPLALQLHQGDSHRTRQDTARLETQARHAFGRYRGPWFPAQTNSPRCPGSRASSTRRAPSS